MVIVSLISTFLLIISLSPIPSQAVEDEEISQMLWELSKTFIKENGKDAIKSKHPWYNNIETKYRRLAKDWGQFYCSEASTWFQEKQDKPKILEEMYQEFYFSGIITQDIKLEGEKNRKSAFNMFLQGLWKESNPDSKFVGALWKTLMGSNVRAGWVDWIYSSGYHKFLIVLTSGPVTDTVEQKTNRKSAQAEQVDPNQINPALSLTQPAISKEVSAEKLPDPEFGEKDTNLAKKAQSSSSVKQNSVNSAAKNRYPATTLTTNRATNMNGNRKQISNKSGNHKSNDAKPYNSASETILPALNGSLAQHALMKLNEILGTKMPLAVQAKGIAQIWTQDVLLNKSVTCPRGYRCIYHKWTKEGLLGQPTELITTTLKQIHHQGKMNECLRINEVEVNFGCVTQVSSLSSAQARFNTIDFGIFFRFRKL